MLWLVQQKQVCLIAEGCTQSLVLNIADEIDFCDGRMLLRAYCVFVLLLLIAQLALVGYVAQRGESVETAAGADPLANSLHFAASFARVPSLLCFQTPP